MTDLDKAAVEQMHKEGYTQKQIGAALGVSPAMVCRVLQGKERQREHYVQRPQYVEPRSTVVAHCYPELVNKIRGGGNRRNVF